MQKLLVKLFIKNYQDTANPVVRSKYGSLAGVVGIISGTLALYEGVAQIVNDELDKDIFPL